MTRPTVSLPEPTISSGWRCTNLLMPSAGTFSNTLPTPLDLLSYNSSGKLDLNNADPRLRVIRRAAKTHLANRDFVSDPADFVSVGPVDPFNAAISSGTLYSWTTLDSRIMDVLGYRVAASASAAQPPPPTPNFSVLDTTTHTTSTSNGAVYNRARWSV